MRRYVEVLAKHRFGVFWGGATVSVLGDAMTLVALTWMVLEITGSPFLVGLLAFCFTAPVVIGGLGAGVLLDRFDKRRVLMVDTAARGLVMASVPVLAALEALPVWYLFAVAAVYGLLKMVPLAGVPAMIPALVDEEDLTTANALESISYGVGGIAGPAAAGVLIGLVGAPAVIAVDAATYFLFLGALAFVRGDRSAATTASASPLLASLGPAIRLVVSAPAILATTLMFMAFNVGEGVFLVLIPVYAVNTLSLDATGYGALLAAFSGGLLAGAIAVGALPTPARLGRAIAAGQVAAGLILLGFLLAPDFPAALAISGAFGLGAAPLTIWAQTIRMQIIPAELRGRVFALLRTMMQSTPPIGALAAGALLGGGGIGMAVAVAAGLIVLPGVFGVFLPALAGTFARRPGVGPVAPEQA